MASVYQPLAPETPLFELWRGVVDHAVPRRAAVPAPVLARYQAHVAVRRAASGAPLTAAIAAADAAADQRISVRDFHAFFPEFLSRIGAPPHVIEQAVSFPTLDLFDARAVEAGDAIGIFISSRMLDAIDVLARMVTLNTRVFAAIGRAVERTGRRSTGLVMPVWWPLLSVQLGLADFDGVPPARVRDVVFNTADRGFGQRRLTHYVAQAMFALLERIVRGTPAEASACVEAALVRRPSTGRVPADARYLATMVLTFIALHEHCHIVHQHNSLDPADPSLPLAQLANRLAAHGDPSITASLNLYGTTMMFEQDADCFAIEAAPEPYREPLLDAASLWLTALACADRGGTGWMPAVFATQGRVHPQYAMRVFFLNGRYSTGDRQGEVAQWVRRAAEDLEAQPTTMEMPLETLLPLARQLISIAEQEAAA
jgi:hypothetical protein